MSFHGLKFFKIMQNHELQNGELRVPSDFVNLIDWEGMSNPISLQLPNGVEWKIFWVKRDGNIWLQKNWEKFAPSLKHGYILVFKYIAASSFKVTIFGRSTLEIDYSNIKCADYDVGEGTTKNGKEVGVNDDCVEVSDESEKPTQAVEKKKTKHKTSFNPHIEIDGAPSQRTNVGKRKVNMDFDATQQNVSGANRGVIVKAKKCSRTEVVKDIARSSHSDENPYFTLKLSPSYAHGNALAIPSEFSRKYLYGLEESASIRVGEDGAREVMLTFDKTNRRSVVTSGWKSICKEYNFQVGDLCKFEMTQHKPVSFKITIMIPARDEPSPHHLQGYNNGNKANQQNKDKAESGQFGRKRKGRRSPKTHVLGNSEGPNMEQNTFEASIKLEYACIPKGFLERHGFGHGKMMELKVGETSWPVKVIYYPKYGYARFCGGWQKFVSESKLKNGDTCLFELIDQENAVFKVSIVL